MVIFDQRIRKYLAKCSPALSGQCGHDQTFKVACSLVWGFALPRNEALRYLRVYNETCDPPWSEAELVHKVESALGASQIKPVGYLLCFNK